ncbi:MAG TPA: SRPBCC family protein [Bacillota bacterium]|nr:SRPBCC family protein [Bacillota bacterium]
MLEATIRIERPVDVVWEYFIQPANWEEWYGGGLKEVVPRWTPGAELHWELGGSSIVSECRPRETLTIRGRFGDTSYCFKSQEDHMTMVRIVQNDPKGGAVFTDGGSAQRVELEMSLQRLKRSIEGEATEVSPVENDGMDGGFERNIPDFPQIETVIQSLPEINNPGTGLVDETETYFDRLTIRGNWWLQRLWAGKYISPQRLAQAVRYYAAMEASEKPLFLFANTHFRSPKYGFLITDRRIYYRVDMKNSWKKAVGSVPLDGASSVCFIVKEVEGLNLDLPCIYINGESVGSCSYLSASEIDVLNDFFQRRARPAANCSEEPNWLAEGERILHVLNRNIYGFGWTNTKVYITNMRIAAVPGGTLTLRPTAMDALDSYFKSFALTDIREVAVSPPAFRKDFVNVGRLTMEMHSGQKVTCEGPLVNLVELADWIELTRDEQEPFLRFGDPTEVLLYNDGAGNSYDIFSKFYRSVLEKAARLKFSSRMCITNKRIIYYRIENFGGSDHKRYDSSNWSYWYRAPLLSWVEISFDHVVALKTEQARFLPNNGVSLELKESTWIGFITEGIVIPPVGTGKACYVEERIPSTQRKIVSFSELGFANKKCFDIAVEALRKAISECVQSPLE